VSFVIVVVKKTARSARKDRLREAQAHLGHCGIGWALRAGTALCVLRFSLSN
jgi:hypothetical protein